MAEERPPLLQEVDGAAFEDGTGLWLELRAADGRIMRVALGPPEIAKLFGFVFELAEDAGAQTRQKTRVSVDAHALGVELLAPLRAPGYPHPLVMVATGPVALLLNAPPAAWDKLHADLTAPPGSG